MPWKRELLPVLRAINWGDSKARGHSMTRAWICWRLTHMPDGWCWLSAGISAGAWLPHSLAAGLQEEASQESKAEGSGIFYDLASEVTEHHFLCTLLAVSVIKFYLGSEEESIDFMTWKACQCYLVWIYGMGHVMVPSLNNTVWSGSLLGSRVHIPPTGRMHLTPLARALSLLPYGSNLVQDLTMSTRSKWMRLLGSSSLSWAPWVDFWRTVNETNYIFNVHTPYSGGRQRSATINPPMQKASEYSFSTECSSCLHLSSFRLRSAHRSWGIKWPLFILYSLCSFQSKKYNFFKPVGFLYINFQSTPLDKNHTHKSLFKKPYSP